ncbi:AAA family ATPase [Paenibacillus sedimenti]|uniref:AAA family ATPase n=1 Tax=Paenibacillus sedimenti TaxID=2770274 RepID=A0A926KQE5_9BACL|nr:AAA family ATPase [Paenibacillus sedimenti]MBD0381021.1 AAA family ATPase [Paenibacillus sedimenti]
MRIISIHVEGFGSLRDKQLDTDTPLALFYGANEAGKSTLMGFVRAVLFGFPTRQNRAERYEPLGGGAHGGALTLLDAQGQRIRVERYDASAAGGRRASAGLVKVTLGDGTTGGEELLNTLLGGLSADLFRSLFAFGLTELQELRTLQTDELSGYLYSAGLGVSGSAIMEAERKLTAQADGLFKPRGRNQEINRLLRELEGLVQTLRRSRDYAADYDRLQEERRSAEERIAALERQQDALRAELHKLSLAGKARSGWIRLRQVGQELAALPALASFPEHASARLDALEAELERVEAERTRLVLKQQGLLSQLQALDLLPADLLAHQIELNHLLEQASTYEENKRSAQELGVEMNHLRTQLDRLLKQIDERWEERTLAAFPVSIALREQVRSYKERLHSSRVEELRARTELESLYQQRIRAVEQIQSIEMDLHRKAIPVDLAGPITSSNEVDGSAALQRLARDYARWQLLVRDAQHLREKQVQEQQHRLLLEETAAQSKAASKRNQQRLLVITSLLTVIVPGLLLWKDSWSTAVLALALLAGVTLYVYTTGRPTKVKRASRAIFASNTGAEVGIGTEAGVVSSESQRLAEELRNLEQNLQEQVERQFSLQKQGLAFKEAAAASIETAMKVQGQGVSIHLQELQPQLDAWMREAELSKQQRNELRRQLDKLLDAREALLLLQQHEEERSAALRQLEIALGQVESEWYAWLQALELNEKLSPDAALETIQAVEQGHELLRQLRKQESKQEALQSSIEGYENTLASLLRLPAQSQHESLLALKRWKEQEQRQLRLLAEQQRLEQLVIDGEREMQALGESRQRMEERLAQLLAEACANDRSELRKNEREQAERSRLIEEQKTLEAALESLAGGSLLPDIVELIEMQGEDEWMITIQALQDQLSEAVEAANGLRQEVGKLTGALEKLEQGSEHADHLLEAEAYRATIRGQVDQYAVASFASLLMKKARDVYERERQPSVLQRASVYFSQMTGGKFIQIKAPFGEHRLVAIRANGQSLDTSQLSRGTAEQLYLSMRFALVQEYAGKAVLPLVMDDILVNFDEERMESCLRVIADVSKRHQVLLFTCHSHVRDAAAKLIANHRLIEL